MRFMGLSVRLEDGLLLLVSVIESCSGISVQRVLFLQLKLLRARWRVRRRVAGLGSISLSVWRVAVVEAP